MKFFGSIPPPPKPPLRPPAPPLRRSHAAPAKMRARVAERVQPITPGIVGRWRDPDGTDMAEFRADGALIEHSSSGEKIQGRYSLTGDRLVIQIEGVDSLSFIAAIGAETLELRDAEGQVTRYVRD